MIKIGDKLYVVSKKKKGFGFAPKPLFIDRDILKKQMLQCCSRYSSYFTITLYVSAFP